MCSFEIDEKGLGFEIAKFVSLRMPLGPWDRSSSDYLFPTREMVEEN